MKKLRAIVIGAGNRGISYSNIMHKMPEKFEVVAVAEPIESRRNHIRDTYNIPDEMCFADFEPLFSLGKIADFAVIATMDRDHFVPTMKAIDLGYNLLLEKPIAPTPEECIAITKAANEKSVRIVICTVLRYTDLFIALKQIIDSGKIGKVMSINHEECVGDIHQTHSFVRGNWGNSEKSSTMLLQKSCHDIDILQWLIGKKCKRVQSFGALTYFTRENAPKGTPEYCIQGCPIGENCPYNAIKLYYDDKENVWFRTTATKEQLPTDDDVLKAITETQYGKCVFKCDNDVVDHQIVNMIFEDDITVSFTMNAFNKGGRFTHIMGTKGELKVTFNDEIVVKMYNFESKTEEIISLKGRDGITSGHGGGDEGIMADLYDYFTDNYSGTSISKIEESLYNHLLVFAAEESRKNNVVIDVSNFINSINLE